MEFPVEYIFKEVPNHLPDGADPVETALGEMDHCGVAIGMIGSPYGKLSQRALQEHPDRFVSSIEVDPNDITGAVRKIRAAKDDHDIKAVTSFPAGFNPQVPVDDRRYYPIYQTCIDLDIPVIVNAGIAGPRVPVRVPGRHAVRPGLLRLPGAADRDAPRRRAVAGARGEADAEVAGPVLHAVGVRSEVLPEGDHRLREHARRRQGHVRGVLPDGAQPAAHLRGAARTCPCATRCGRSSCARTLCASSRSNQTADGGVQPVPAADAAVVRSARRRVHAPPRKPGFIGITGMDHLAPPLAESQPMYEAIVTNMWLAAHTERLRVGSLVLCDAFRHPAVLARQAVSIDHASGGRFELGIGWGSVPDELAMFGAGLHRAARPCAAAEGDPRGGPRAVGG